MMVIMINYRRDMTHQMEILHNLMRQMTIMDGTLVPQDISRK